MVNTADIRHTRNAALVVRSVLHASSSGTLADADVDADVEEHVDAEYGDAATTLRMARASVGVSTCSPASIAASTSSPPYPPSKDFSKLDSTSSEKTSPFVAWRTEDGVAAAAIAPTGPRPRRCVRFVTPVKRLGVDTSAMTAASSAVPSDGGDSVRPPASQLSSPSANVRRRGVSSMGPGVGPVRVSFVDTFETSVGLCTRGVGSLSDDAALPGIHGDILYDSSGDPLSSSTWLADASRDGSAVLAATDADDIVVAPTGDPNEPIASATANDIVTASSSAAAASSSSSSTR